MDDRFSRTKCKLHFKEWSYEVRRNRSLAFKIPEELLNSLPNELDKYVIDVLNNELKLQKVGNYWEAKDY